MIRARAERNGHAAARVRWREGAPRRGCDGPRRENGRLRCASLPPLVALALAPQRMSWYAMVDTRIWEAGREVWEAGMQGGMGGMGGRHSCNFVCCVGGIIVL